ncbi:MAG: RES family NAD+ phosphorylase [Bryobacteraceae bacterium]
MSPWLLPDLKLFERLLGVGFFEYGPRLWMVGEVAPLKALQDSDQRRAVIDRIIREYPTVSLTPEHLFYRLRVNPRAGATLSEYDSPPSELLGRGRLDSTDFPVLYGSPDLELCLHECRVTAEDELYAATLAANATLRLLDLSVILEEQLPITEFESLDMAVHMLFLAGKHAYGITREVAR